MSKPKFGFQILLFFVKVHNLNQCHSKMYPHGFCKTCLNKYLTALTNDMKCVVDNKFGCALVLPSTQWSFSNLDIFTKFTEVYKVKILA